MKKPLGRPIKYPGTFSKTIGFSLPASLIPRIDAAAKAREDSRSGLVAAAITAYLNESQSQYEAMPENALIS